MKIENYTLFYCAEDGKMHAGTCREEKEVLVDVNIGEAVEIGGYRGDGLILTLTGLEFETTADIALVVPENTTIVLESGVSRLTVHAQGPEANVAVLYVKGDMTITGGEGKLICDASSTNADNCSWSRGICVRYGDLTVSGGCLDITCGACQRKPGALYAGGGSTAASAEGGDHHHRRNGRRIFRAQHDPCHRRPVDDWSPVPGWTIRPSFPAPQRSGTAPLFSMRM